MKRHLRIATALAVCVAGVQARPAPAVIQGMPSGFIEETVASGLGFPTAIAFLPDGRSYTALKSGLVKVLQGGTVLATNFIDLRSTVHDNHDRGLLGLAIHPQFPNPRTSTSSTPTIRPACIPTRSIQPRRL